MEILILIDALYFPSNLYNNFWDTLYLYIQDVQKKFWQIYTADIAPIETNNIYYGTTDRIRVWLAEKR